MIEKEEFKKIVETSKSKSEICRKLGLKNGGGSFRKIHKLFELFNIDLSNFKTIRVPNIKYKKIIKTCPICNNAFETQKDSKNEKTTCSYSCSNTYFRSGKNNPNYKNIDEIDVKNPTFSAKYRKICFKNHKHECVICGEYKMLDVHHFDQNKLNNEPNNLIPICATHHNYLHSKKYKNEIIDKVIKYRNNYIKNNNTL